MGLKTRAEFLYFRNVKVFLHILIFFFLIPVAATFSQSKKDLEEDKKKVEEEIKYTNKLLEATRKTRVTSLNELAILENKVAKREELIVAMNREIYFLELQVSQYGDSIRILKDELEELKEEYASMIYFAYKNRNLYNRIMFIFASDDFNQAYQRLKYFQYYNAFRAKQAELIVSTRDKIERKTAEISAIKNDKEGLLLSLEEEKEQLLRERQDKNNTVSQLSQKERDLKKTLKEKEKAAQKLQSAIERIIAEEMRKAEEADRKAGKFSLTPEEMALSDNFQTNRGKLPWPVERGIVSSTFGEHPHPVLSRVKTKNNGINILTDKDSEARAVFGGTVTRVLSVPNNNNVIIVRHGEYLTVYSNLDEVYVSQGEKVETKQPIGTIFTDPDESKTELHFEVWKSKNLMNPTDWLIRK
jgi:septal ring factor EnvC (AmiA/AmiB activator)